MLLSSFPASFFLKQSHGEGYTEVFCQLCPNILLLLYYSGKGEAPDEHLPGGREESNIHSLSRNFQRETFPLQPLSSHSMA